MKTKFLILQESQSVINMDDVSYVNKRDDCYHVYMKMSKFTHYLSKQDGNQLILKLLERGYNE